MICNFDCGDNAIRITESDFCIILVDFYLSILWTTNHLNQHKPVSSISFRMTSEEYWSTSLNIFVLFYILLFQNSVAARAAL